MTARPLSEMLEEAFIRSRDLDASLADRLQAFADAVREMGELFQTSVDRLVARLREHEAGEHAPKPGEPMPDFVMPDEQGRLVTLERPPLERPGRHHLPSRPLVPLLPHQHQGAGGGTG